MKKFENKPIYLILKKICLHQMKDLTICQNSYLQGLHSKYYSRFLMEKNSFWLKALITPFKKDWMSYICSQRNIGFEHVMNISMPDF